MNPLLRFDAPVLLDGGLATALEERGFDLDDPLWSARMLADDPDAIRAVHAAYLEAGADVLITSSYQASIEGLRQAGRSVEEAEALLLRSSTLALEARDARVAGHPSAPRRPLVAASIGPWAAFRADGSEYTGDYDVGRDELRRFHAQRWHILDASGVDLFACETIPSAAEVKALLDLLRETPDRWAWISVQCRDDEHIADGTPVREIAAQCDAVGNVAAVGVNCTKPEYVAALLAQIASATDKPRIAYPNAGETYDIDSRSWHGGAGAGDWVRAACTWVDAGATAVGGCCRIGPERIAELREALRPSG